MHKYTVRINGKEIEAEVLSHSEEEVVFKVKGKQYDVKISPLPTAAAPSIAAAPAVSASFAPSKPSSSLSAAVRSNGTRSAPAVHAPMPGIVIQLLVSKGQEVSRGQTVAVIEAMKMENNISAAMAGVVGEVHVKVGQEVENNALLISLSQ